MEKFHEVDLESVGKRIRAARNELGLTQGKAANRTDVTAQYWSLLETGRERGSVSTYMQIADALNLTLDDLFYEDAEIRRVHRAYSKDDLMADCTVFERAIISEMVLALIEILERNRRR